MIIDKEIVAYLINENEDIKIALSKIEANEQGSLVVIDSAGRLVGVMTDGDFRRWIIKGGKAEISIKMVMNKQVVFANIEDSSSKISKLLDHKIKFVPLLDTAGRCVAIARKRSAQFKIGKHLIGEGHECFIIAEIGNNHNGNYQTACSLVDRALEAGANCAKFQMRDLNTLYKNSGNWDDPEEDLGSQYTLDLLSRFQLSNDDLFRIFDYCKKVGITPLCTPWDRVSVDMLEKYGIESYKSASADFTNLDFLRKITQTGKPIICSTGMTEDHDIQSSVKLLKEIGAQYALLHCNSTYPAPFNSLNLRYMLNLKAMGECAVGYSSHDRGINISIGAVALGANIIEKHFTLDRGMEGNDHKVSLLPNEFSEMVAGIRQLEQALGSQNPRKISQGEIMNREILGKSLIINVPVVKGEVIEDHMLDVRSPGKGLQPNQRHLIVGKPATRDLRQGQMLFMSDTKLQKINARNYNLPLKFGIPIRYHDLSSLVDKSNFDLLEFHLSYADLKLNPSSFLSKRINKELVVHAPELFKSDHILDLCSINDSYRSISINNLQDVVDKTLEIFEWCSKESAPKIIVNVGGFSADKPLDRKDRLARYRMVLEAFKAIDSKGVEFLPQTMPPFPWHFGGQRYQNLFIDPDEIVSFCSEYGYRVCFDISHSKLACNHNHWSFSEFIKKVGPYAAHLHIADASGVDGEGLQINEGDIDFPVFISDILQHAPTASFIPEIWQGHKDNAEGFWIALDRLEKLFLDAQL